MTVRIQQDLDKFTEGYALLKYVRGEAMSPDHWVEMYRLLDIAKTTTLEGLTFGTFVDCMPKV